MTATHLNAHRFAQVTSLVFLLPALAGCAVAAPPAKAPSPKLGNDTVSSIVQITNGGEQVFALDSVPSPDASIVFVTGHLDAGKDQGVYRVPASGGDMTKVFAGAPFVKPTGIGISTDGKQIFVTDPAAGNLFALPAEGGEPKVIAGTAGTIPRGMDVIGDMIYFTGKANGEPAIFKILAAGGDAMVVAKGSPLVNPDGIAVSANGVLYVSDHTSDAAGTVWKVADGKITPLVEKVKLGNPAGIALLKGDGLLIVSSHQPNSDADQVLLVNLANGETGAVTKVVGENSAAGGVHRAHNVNVFSWSDIQRPGHVYIVRP